MANTIPKTMRALRMLRDHAASPPSMALEEVPIPKVPSGHVLVKVAASPIQPSDVINANGGFGLTRYPRTPGRDFAGSIVVGPADRIGQQVFGTSGNTYAFTEDGFQAEYAVVAEDAVVEKPGSLSFVQAATAGVPFATADLMLDNGRAKKGDTILVLGANGAVGKAATLLALHRGCQVFRAVRGSGGDVDTTADPKLSTVLDLTNGRGVDVVLDTVGQLPLITAAIVKLAEFGRFVTITAPRAGTRTLEIDLLDFYRDSKTIIGCNSISHSAQEQAQRLKSMSSVFESDRFQSLEDKGWEEIPLQDAVAAYKAVATPRKKYVIVTGST